MTIAGERPTSQENKQWLHVVVLPYPAKGHSIPLLHFAKRLHSVGVTVTYVNVFDHLSKEIFKTLDVLDSSIRVVSIGKPPANEGPGSLPYVKYVNDLVPDTESLMHRLIAEHEQAPPACIVSDMFLGWTQVVANKFNIPRYVLFASPASALATMLHMPELIRQGSLPVIPSRRQELIYDIPGVPPTRLQDLPSPMQDHTDYVYPFYARNCKQMHEATGVLINTYYELEHSYIDALRKTIYGKTHGQGGHLLSILPVGPMLPNEYFKPPAPHPSIEARDPCLQWMDKQPDTSVVFISFGSVAILPIPQIQELALGLEASGQRFLLVIRPPLNPNNLPLIPEGFEKGTEGRGFVLMGWAPQLRILSHPALGGFVTHCGWNSTLEAICRGVPMLAWPIQAEQAMNARFLVDDVKAALEMRNGTDGFVSKEKVARAVICLLTEPEGIAARSNVQKLQKLALNAVAEGGSVCTHLVDFIEEVKSWKHDSALPNMDPHRIVVDNSKTTTSSQS